MASPCAAAIKNPFLSDSVAVSTLSKVDSCTKKSASVASRSGDQLRCCKPLHAFAARRRHTWPASPCLAYCVSNHEMLSAGFRASHFEPNSSWKQLQMFSLAPPRARRKNVRTIVRSSAEDGSVLVLPDLSPSVADGERSVLPKNPLPIGSAHDPGSAPSHRRQFLKEMSFQELEAFVVEELGDESRRAHLLWWWLYRHGMWAKDPAEMEGVSRSFRHKLEEHAEFDSLILDGVRTGTDGTRKLTFRLKDDDGGGVVETVLIPKDRSRNTVCVSSQLGCAMGCEFCFTAKMGLRKHLSVGQMVDQVVQTRRLFSEEVGRITNVVFMGMGEPLHNLDNVLKAVSTLTDLNGLQCAAPRITVSTSGLVPEIRRFCRESAASLAVSLNATTDEVRSEIMPVNRRYNLAALLGVLREEFPRTKQQARVFLEYIMLAGVNDSFDDAHRLLELTADLPCKINLIVFNPHEGTRFAPSAMAHVLAFRDVLIQGGRMVFIRQSRGDDEMAACGQLGQPGTRKSSLQAL